MVGVQAGEWTAEMLGWYGTRRLEEVRDGAYRIVAI